jgi:soluble P-type ATPase
MTSVNRFILEIPGRKKIEVDNLILDFNGTIAENGLLIPGVEDRIIAISEFLKISVVTADTYGNVEKQMLKLPVETVIIPKKEQDKLKLKYLLELGPEKTISMGNGRNDMLVLKKSVLGIGIIKSEGCYSGVISASDLLYTDVLNALDCLIYPERLIAALRN